MNIYELALVRLKALRDEYCPQTWANVSEYDRRFLGGPTTGFAHGMALLAYPASRRKRRAISARERKECGARYEEYKAKERSILDDYAVARGFITKQ